MVKSIHKTLYELNGLLPETNSEILYDEAKDPKSSIYSAIQEESSSVPATLKRQIIDLSCLTKRCEEEIAMVKGEMKRLVSFIENEIRLIDEAVNTLVPQSDVPVNAGLTACLKKKKMVYSTQISSLMHLWSGIRDSFIVPAEAVKTYEHLSGIDHNLDDETPHEPENDELMMFEDTDDDSFELELELSSDSELSGDEQ